MGFGFGLLLLLLLLLLVVVICFVPSLSLVVCGFVCRELGFVYY
jgi:hypothetical protein